MRISQVASFFIIDLGDVSVCMRGLDYVGYIAWRLGKHLLLNQSGI